MAGRGGPAVRLNPADRETGLALLGTSNGRQRGGRKGGAQWVGIRADHGVIDSGRWAYCVWNDTGGNLRVGWSCADGDIKLGTDAWGFGYGGTATKSHANKFEKYGQTYGPGDAITCLVDLDRRAIMYMKNGREIPGDAFRFDGSLSGWPLFPHIYTKEATFSVSFDGSGGAPPLQGGFQWLAHAGRQLVPSSRKAAAGAYAEVDRPVGGAAPSAPSGRGGPEGKFVLTSFGWRTVDEAGASTSSQEWRASVDAYVKHFTSLLELEYEAEREAVAERVQKRSPAQLEADGVGFVGLSAEFDREAGRITLWAESGRLPYLAEISRGRTVLLSAAKGGVDIDDATKTISGEVESITDHIVLSTQYERLPGPVNSMHGQVSYRVDLGPNIIAYKRIDRMLDELQRCLGVDQAKHAKHSIEKMNSNRNLEGLLLPGAALANALYADITESSAAASKWDPMERPKPNPAADISRAAQEPDIGAPRHTAKGHVPGPSDGKSLNASQRQAVQLVLDKRRRFSLIQGPPGTGKTTTAVAICCGWLRSGRGPILASSFSNRGTDNLADGLHNLGVRVLRMGLCSSDKPYSLEARLAEVGAKRGDKGLKLVMDTIDVVCATCIGCGMGPLDKLKFPFIVVDEAAQVIEPAVILPLGKGAVQAVMVGDQCQLPATVLSQEAQKGGLDISMFDRLLSMGMEVQMLTEQYRMHPQIAAFSSWRFYKGALRSGIKDSDRQRSPRLPITAPLGFLHVEAEERSRGSSKVNLEEARCVAWVVERTMQAMPARVTGDEVGVITPYAAQVAEIRRLLPQECRPHVQVSSVDAFQGCEKDVIVLSLVRANRRGDVGFVSDWRRLNVALTRARRLCVVVANISTWLASECALVRDWLGFYSPPVADVRLFHGGSLHPLSEEHLSKVVALREEFARSTPQATTLPRVSVAARDGSGAGRTKHLTLQVARALAEAISKQSEEALQLALAQAAEIGFQNSTVEEAETLLRRLFLLRDLEEAMQGGDEDRLENAILEAREWGVEEDRLLQAEIAVRRLGAERVLAAALAPMAASRPDFEENLRLVLVDARAAGASPAKLQEGESRLYGKVLAEAIASHNEQHLRQTLKKVEDSGAQGREVEKARDTLERWVAMRELRDALRAGEEVALMTATARAKAAGLQGQELHDAELALRQAEVARDLHEATLAEEEHPLAQAIQEAQEAGLHESLTEEARAVFGRLVATRELQECVNTHGCSDELEAGLMIALSAAGEVGVAPDLVSAGEAKLATVQASKMLAAAVASEDQDMLGHALEMARAAGLSELVISHAEARQQALAEGPPPAAATAAAAPAMPPAPAAAGAVAGGAAAEVSRMLELMLALELAGSVAEDDKAALRRAVFQAKSAGARSTAVSEAERLLRRLDGVAAPPVEASAAKRRRLEAPSSSSTASPAVRKCAGIALELAALRVRKREAVEAEDFDLALEVKQCEAEAAARLEQAQLQNGTAGGAAPTGAGLAALAAELERVRAEKHMAVERENFPEAARLRDREKALEQQTSSGSDAIGGGRDADIAQEALRLLEQGGAQVLTAAGIPAASTACLKDAGEALWQAVAADLRAACSCTAASG